MPNRVLNVLMSLLVALLLGLVLFVPLANADSTSTFLKVSGTNTGLEGLGPALEDSWQYLGVSWTFTSRFTNVSGRIYGYDLFFPAGATNTYFLTDAIGPSATVANVIWSDSSTYSSAGWVDGAIFKNLNFSPGTYYLVITTSA